MAKKRTPPRKSAARTTASRARTARRHGDTSRLEMVYRQVREVLTAARDRAWQAVNTAMVESWNHYRHLLRVDKPDARAFYEAETVNARWSTRELARQIDSLLFERLALSRDKEGVLALARQGQEIQVPSDLVKDPFVLEVRHDNRVVIADPVSRILGRRYLSRPTYLRSKDDRDHSLLVKRRWATKCPDSRAARLAKYGEGYTA